MNARWLSTWTTDVREIDAYWWYLLEPGQPRQLPVEKFPDAVERSEERLLSLRPTPAPSGSVDYGEYR